LQVMELQDMLMELEQVQDSEQLKIVLFMLIPTRLMECLQILKIMQSEKLLYQVEKINIQ